MQVSNVIMSHQSIPLYNVRCTIAVVEAEEKAHVLGLCCSLFSFCAAFPPLHFRGAHIPFNSLHLSEKMFFHTKCMIPSQNIMHPYLLKAQTHHVIKLHIINIIIHYIPINVFQVKHCWFYKYQ